jgi:transcriptional repressor NrdR
MNCPFCGALEIKVLDSRPDTEGRSIRRRRECIQCAKRWRTVERVEDEMPLVIKKNNTYQPFRREKLKTSLEISCGKRPVSASQIAKAVSDIEWEILEQGCETIESQEVGRMVMNHLKTIDEIAYIRYSSVYRRFKDVTELMAEVRDLIGEDALNNRSADRSTDN